MRNLKKILALALALVMTLSLMTVANAFTDDKDIDAKYDEAVEVLSGLKVFKGTGDGSTFAPKQSITRAEVAAIIYRIVTGDVTDAQAGIYKDYAKFKDVASTAWYAGYVNYCANAELIVGDGTNFYPTKTVTGYEALAMILRAVGYDANDEFKGASWQIRVASTAKELGITDTVVEGTLGTAASRETVAELLFRTLVFAPIVKWTSAFGYQPVTSIAAVDIINGTVITQVGGQTLGMKTFGLKQSTRRNIDNWGRPGYYWYTNKTSNTVTTANIVATIEETPVATFTTAVTECDVAAAAGFTGSKTYDLYVNAFKSADVLQATDTVDTVGAQGRLTEVYGDRIVMIDTLLAKVTNVTPATFDAAGHLRTPSRIDLLVYDADSATNATGDAYYRTNGATNYEYAVGDYILLNAYTVSGNRDTAGVVSKNYGSNQGVYAELRGKASSVDGTQTVVWYNTNKHTVNGATYDDAAEMHLDEAGSKTNAHTWFFDQHGNIIGNVEVATQYTYAVMTSIWWAGDASNGSGVARATLKYTDGNDNTVTVARLDGATPIYGYENSTSNNIMKNVGTTIQVATNAATNATFDDDNGDLIHGHLFKVQTLADGTVILTKVNDGTATHTELSNNVDIINRYGYITSATGNIAIDTETQFLVRGSTNTVYTTYLGLNQIPTFKTGAKVDYVLGAGGVADYVYIIGDTVDANANNFVLITGNAYSAILRTVGGVSYWELTLPVPAEDGSTVTLKILDDDNGNMNTVPASLTALTNVAAHGKLFYVSTVNGFVPAAASAVVEIDNTQKTLPGLVGTKALRLDDATMPTGVAGGVINATVDGIYANCRFNITSATQVVGQLAPDMRNKVVYVIYNIANNDVAKVYVLDKNYPIGGTGTIDSLTVTASSGVVVGNYVRDLTFSATANTFNNNIAGVNFGGTVKATGVWQKLNDQTGNFETYTGEVFVAGTYRAVITLTVENTAYQNYSINSLAPINYYGQAGKVGNAFYTDPLTVGS